MRNCGLFLVFGFVAILLCAVALGGALHFYEVPTHAMEPTLYQGDRLAEIPVFRKGSFKRGQLVAFHQPYDPALNGVGRVAGLPGDRIQVKNGHLILNGRPLWEPYLRQEAKPIGEDFPSTANSLIDHTEISRLQAIMYGEWVSAGVLTVPEGTYFILGDNRGHSVDSRTYGPVSQSAIFAQPIFVYAAKASQSHARHVQSLNLEIER